MEVLKDLHALDLVLECGITRGMQFGRVRDPGVIAFELPALQPRSLAVLKQRRMQAAREPWLRLGAPAWSHRDWIGTLYPRGSTARDWLQLYAAKLGAIELNSTFYALPSDSTIERWCESTPPSFRFCPKVPRAISHELQSNELAQRVAAFVGCVRRLGDRLGPAFLQLPERVASDSLPLVAAALAAFPGDFALALEVRHPDWFCGGSLREELLGLLESRRIGTVITDVAGRRDVSHGSLTTPRAFVRFVGEGGHATDEPRGKAWLARLLEWRAAGLESAYFFAHQPDDVLAPQLLSLVAEHARASGIDVESVPLEAATTKQLDLFG